MRYVKAILFFILILILGLALLLFSCEKELILPQTANLSARQCVEVWKNHQTEEQVIVVDEYTIHRQVVTNGRNKGYLCNTKTEFAEVWYRGDGELFMQRSYAPVDRFNVNTDVWQKVRGKDVLYPARIKYYPELGYKVVTRKLNRYVHGVCAIATIDLATGDTLNCRDFECDYEL